MPIKTPARLGGRHAAAIYTAAAIFWTWPLLPNITTGIAWDLGDPMLVSWLMAWVNDSVLALGRGDLTRFMALWDAPIFYPQPFALAYSEHFIPQALMVLPIYALSGNAILSYNVALLATFVISGLGMFLLARALTGSAAAALVAGAVFAFTPYRVAQISHLQILSCQWMPFALLGFRGYFDTGRARPLVWGTAAFVLQSLSSGYLLLFFAPFLAAYVLWEMAARGLWRRRETWLAMAGSAAASAVLIVPYLIPYVVVRQTALEPRRYEEIAAFSANPASYVTSNAYIRWSADLLDAMRDVPENSNFPGVVAIALALVALALVARRTSVRANSIAGASLLFAAIAVVLSFGPHGPYVFLYRYVPGFDGLRVPARFALIAIFWLTIAGAYAAASIARLRRAGVILVSMLALGAVIESRPRPFHIDLAFPEKNAAPLTMTHRLRAAEPLYTALGELRRGVLLELPWGTMGWDLQFMHAQRRHGWPLVNGFSGDFPSTYRRTSSIESLFTDPDRAWWALERSGATHVIVHEWAFPSLDRGRRVSQWLRERGAVELASTANDRLFRLLAPLRPR